ncbi:peroxiredoxin family protein [Caldisalinibacter kiritimatiensis]|uniref:Thiol-disulfide oxidoreductase n=1 Tax=Caldisalinibacter kiritimatiensis TaxID=1304284 RepID=R1CUB4_9FIRM|nr:TlpA disulfide reductase family protein [Caldisalinibacter kiritimatiensis]EOD00269.1 thiol-disulfide oxidoreductase [Caldisalinibacter kiritimatiensis]
MKGKNIIVIVLVIVLGAGLFYFASNMLNKNENIVENNNEVEQENAEDSEEKEQIEESKEETRPEEGYKAPNFTLKNIDGEDVSLDDYKGKIVLLNFWTTTCPYCTGEMPDMNDIYLENKDKDFVILAVNVGEQQLKVKKFIQDKGYDFEVLLDKDADVAIKYLVRGIPVSYFIDEEGVVVKRRVGMMTYDYMKSMIEDIRNN